MFLISLILMAGALALFLIYGLNLGIDFTGGSLMEVEFRSTNYELGKIRESLEKVGINNAVVSQSGDRGVIIKMPEINEEKHQEILAELKKIGDLEEKRFDSIGSVLGAELKRKSITAIIIALVLISIYLAVVFSRVGQVISPWALALGGIVALLHDLLLPIGVFAWLGQFKGVAIDAPMIAAALAILGYSINDTVVVYDRIRENIIKHNANMRIDVPIRSKRIEDPRFLNKSGRFEEIGTNDANKFSGIIHQSIKQTLVRSINTTLTTLFAVIAIYIFGGPTLKNFSLALIIGIASGAYSSIFVASPILMIFHKK